MDATMDPTIPQWKRDLIQRLRNKNKWFSDSCDEQQEQQLLAGTTSVEVGCTVQQPNLTCPSTAAVVVPVANVNVNVSDSNTRKCNPDLATITTIIMVKDRVIDCDFEKNGVTCDEELHYGPGIVKKLKNHYLSLTLRECNAQVRPSILPLRKATSLENLLDDDVVPNNKPSTHFSRVTPRYKESKNFTNNRYNASRGVDLKRAHSVEAISRADDQPRSKHQSFHEDMLITPEGNGVSTENHDSSVKETTVNHKINRPKRITPLMSEKEKPPVDVVKQTKRIFEGKAELRTKQLYHTGDVAAKVACYKNIMNKKPPVAKQKPVLSLEDARKTPKLKQKPIENGWNTEKLSPDIGVIPDVSLIASPREENINQLSLSETPDLILHSSPVPVVVKNVHTPGFRIVTTDNFLKAEVVHSNNVLTTSTKNDESDGIKLTTQKTRYLPPVDNKDRPPLVNITYRKQLPEKRTDNFRVVSPIVFTPLTLQEIEKNHINCTKKVAKVNTPTLGLAENVKNSMEVKTKIQVPKSSLSRNPKEQNSIVFKFTDRSDVPDYVHNDGRIKNVKVQKPKVGEGGIILLPGVSLDESLVDDDGDDWMLMLECPPSPCDIEFINGNILIDGRSSLSQRSKKPKMKIKFEESLPEIYEYPSEASLASEYTKISSPSKEQTTVNSVPTLTGTSLANYIPKLGPTEEFQLGVTRSAPVVTSSPTEIKESYQEDIDEQPVQFSSGTNSDILF